MPELPRRPASRSHALPSPVALLLNVAASASFIVVRPEFLLAVSIVTLMLALAGKLMVKDRLTREAAAGFARRGEHMGMGLVGRTIGAVGIGNIGAELFRLLKPFQLMLPVLSQACMDSTPHIGF